MLDLKILEPVSFASNCYVVADRDASEAAVIDPSVSSERILSAVSEMGAKLTWIILTHGHFDHMFYLDDLRYKSDAQVAVHCLDGDALSDGRINASSLLMRRELTFDEADVLLHDGDAVKIGSFELRVMHTPGHTAGSICLVGPDFVITGDTLFASGIGRTDLSGGSFDDIQDSLERIIKLPGHYAVYPGHGPSTTVEKERKSNIYIKRMPD